MQCLSTCCILKPTILDLPGPPLAEMKTCPHRNMMAPHATATDDLQDQDSAQQNSLKIYLTLFLV